MLPGIAYLKMCIINMNIRIRTISPLSETLKVPFSCFADETQNTSEFFWLFHIVIGNFIMPVLIWTGVLAVV